MECSTINGTLILYSIFPVFRKSQKRKAEIMEDLEVSENQNKIKMMSFKYSRIIKLMDSTNVVAFTRCMQTKPV